MPKKVVIIGAGLAGLSLASELADEGFEIEILEANTYLGGRASDLVDRKMHDPVPIGPHVFCSWYNNFFRFLEKVGAKKSIAWERQVFIELVHESKHHVLRFHNLPAPFFTIPWIINHPFMGLRDKLSNFGLLGNIYFSPIHALERLDEMNAYEYLSKKGVSQKCINVFWRFITLSLLNVPLERCSAAEFALLIKRWAHLKRRQFGFPKIGLGDVYTDEAERYITERNGIIRRRTAVQKIEYVDGKIASLLVAGPGGTEHVRGDMYVSTVNPIVLKGLIPDELRTNNFFNVLETFEGVPYLSVNLWFDKKISAKRFWAMLDASPDNHRYLNTDFYDFTNIYEAREGASYIASNIINNEKAERMSDTEIIEKTVQEIREAFPDSDASVVHSHVHRIPYVVYAPTPGSRSHRLKTETPIQNFYLAGDWLTSELPQCMESAVRSGYRCAEAILHRFGKEKDICDPRVF